MKISIILIVCALFCSSFATADTQPPCTGGPPVSCERACTEREGGYLCAPLLNKQMYKDAEDDGDKTTIPGTENCSNKYLAIWDEEFQVYDCVNPTDGTCDGVVPATACSSPND